MGRHRRPDHAQSKADVPVEALQEGMEEALRGGPVMKVLVDLTA